MHLKKKKGTIFFTFIFFGSPFPSCSSLELSRLSTVHMGLDEGGGLLTWQTTSDHSAELYLKGSLITCGGRGYRLVWWNTTLTLKESLIQRKFRSDSERKGRPECHPQLRLLNKATISRTANEKLGLVRFSQDCAVTGCISTFTNISLFLLHLCYLPFCENSNLAH